MIQFAVTCTCRKVVYASQVEALKAIRALQGGGRRTAYECPDVPGLWHLTSLPRRFKPGRKP